MELLLLLSSVTFAEEPCQGHAWPDRLEGEHFWIEWEEDLISVSQAQSALDVLEASWEVYSGDLGWAEPPTPIVVEVYEPLVDSAAARCITEECEGVDMPRIELYPTVFGLQFQAATVAHELAHAFQYAYMGNYIDSLTSWLWWMEGCATWLTTWSGEESGDWAYSVGRYLEHGNLSLHHGADAYLDAAAGAHMYGTAALATFLDANHGGPDTLRATWEYGRQHTGEEIWFPDALEDQGLDFAQVWPHYLATLPTVALPGGSDVAAGPSPEQVVLSLPDSGEPASDRLPQTLGFSVVEIDPAAGAAAHTLAVTVEVAAGQIWHGALVTTTGTVPGSEIIDWTPLVFSENSGSASLSFDGSAAAWLVVSPEIGDEDDEDGTSYAWSAELIADPVEESEGCGCSAAGAAGPWLLIPLALWRRRESHA